MRVLMISADKFEDTELLFPLYRLREERVEVDVASLERRPLKGKRGYVIEANRGIDEVSAADYDMLVLPGGKAPATLRADERVLEVARGFVAAEKPVAAICHGPQILAAAGVVRGRTLTSYKGVAKELRRAGANYEDREVVVDDNLITARDPADLPAFTREIVRRVHAAPEAARKGAAAQS